MIFVFFEIAVITIIALAAIYTALYMLYFFSRMLCVLNFKRQIRKAGGEIVYSANIFNSLLWMPSTPDLLLKVNGEYVAIRIMSNFISRCIFHVVNDKFCAKVNLPFKRRIDIDDFLKYSSKRAKIIYMPNINREKLSIPEDAAMSDIIVLYKFPKEFVSFSKTHRIITSARSGENLYGKEYCDCQGAVEKILAKKSVLED